jgi:DNA-binding GntR family transcriptional regulator
MHSTFHTAADFETAQLHRPALHRELVERLRDMIVDGSLTPGERLNERLLCERFGVSRTPLREAILILAREGLVEIMPRRGSRVAVLGIEQVRDIIELLGGLEAMAGELACQRATEAAVAAVKARHAEMLGFFEAGDMLGYFKANEAVHDLIVAAAGNAELTAQHRTLRARVLRALYMPNIRPERWRAAISEHEAFVDALADRDGRRLSRLLRGHKERTWDELRPWLERQTRNDAGTGKTRPTSRPD